MGRNSLKPRSSPRRKSPRKSPRKSARKTPRKSPLKPTFLVFETESESSASEKRFPVTPTEALFDSESTSEESNTSLQSAIANVDNLLSTTRSGTTSKCEDSLHNNGVPTYTAKDVVILIQDIHDILLQHANGHAITNLFFSIKRKVWTKAGHSLKKRSNRHSNNSSDTEITNHESDSSDSSSGLLESAVSSESGSESETGSNFSWESEFSSVMSDSSLSHSERVSSTSCEDSDSSSEELEELEDDFVLHTGKKQRESKTRKRRVLPMKLRKNTSIGKRIAQSSSDTDSMSDVQI